MKKRLLPRLRVALMTSILAACGLSLPGQDFSVLRINEVMTDNEMTGPTDSSGFRHDLVEIFNSGDVDLTLGAPTFNQRIALSDTATQPILGLWTFPAGMTIPAKGFLTIFVEADPEICDPHASFGLAKDGSEPITLWGRAGTDGKRPIIDQVFLPPLDADVSFGRFPDGAGPAPVPLSATFDHFRFNPPGQATFGECTGTCANFDRVCRGAPNGPGGNIAPSVSRIGHATNNPAALAPVDIVGRVKDDKLPTPTGAGGSIASVTLKYRVNGGPEQEVPMVFDEALGVMTDPLQPLDRFTHWNATIPGQPKDAVVEFSLHVEDSEGLIAGDPDPEDLCPEGVGPCNQVGLPGPNCVLEPEPSKRFAPCNVRFNYLSGYEIPARLTGLVINEIIANQTSVLQDVTDSMFDDIVELFNGSTVPVDLSGLWMSDKAFHPKGYQFPAGSTIAPGEHLIVWADGDGGLCPRPGDKQDGDGQDCPDPTDPAKGEYHLDFALERNGDEIYIFEEIPPTTAGLPAGFGVIHGTEFGPQMLNKAWSLVPDGSRSGTFRETDPTPGAANPGVVAAGFKRGDSDGSCTVNITDAVFVLDYLFQGGTEPACLDAADSDDTGTVEITDPVYLLNHLFLGGPAPPPPGIDVVGSDTTGDTLADCAAPSCA